MKTAGKRVIWLANGLVDTVILLVVLLLLAAGGYALWDSGLVNAAADSKQYAVYKPTDENGGLSFAELQEINPEVLGWLDVYGTNIDYPVAQGSDNMKYVNTDAAGNYSLSGSIFMDSGSSGDFSDFNPILYGHHMEKKTMFGELGLFADRGYFEARKYGSLYYGGKDHGLEFFAFLHADAYDNTVFRPRVTGKEAREAYLAMLLERASNVRDIGVTADDQIVLLSTCSSSSTNGRDILVARITDERYNDSFVTEKSDGGANPAADSGSGLWAQAPLWAKVAVIILALLALLVPACYYIKKRRGRSGKRLSAENDEK
ncbi:MAG: class B sortase [Clostridiales Family XIII bacterium]|jgi:sortase B|nr:class B sortase [Clostridiales Family XIII bacterium]